MKNGGYVIVDLGGVNFKYDTPVKIDGIYNKIKGGTKPLLLSGIVIGGNAYRDRFVSPDIKGTAYVLPITETHFMSGPSMLDSGSWLQVSDNDTVTAKQYTA